MRVGKQAELQLVGQGQVAFQTLLLPRNLFVEPGILDGDGDLGGQGGQRALVIFGEVAAAGVLKIERRSAPR